jgi:hypothetical protein
MTSSNGTTPFTNVSALGLDALGNLYVGDDTTAGAFILTGSVCQHAGRHLFC